MIRTKTKTEIITTMVCDVCKEDCTKSDPYAGESGLYRHISIKTAISEVYSDDIKTMEIHICDKCLNKPEVKEKLKKIRILMESLTSSDDVDFDDIKYAKKSYEILEKNKSKIE
jgi:hypothetical protein